MSVGKTATNLICKHLYFSAVQGLSSLVDDLLAFEDKDTKFKSLCELQH